MFYDIAMRHSEYWIGVQHRLDSESRQLSPGNIGINHNIAIMGRLDYRVKPDNDAVFCLISAISV